MAHILIIDDEPQIRLVMRKMLESEGYTVTDAADGKEGLESYQENPPDLVITDLIMPGKEGIETIRELKEKNPEVKIIAMSGGGKNNPEDYLRLAKVLGAIYTFDKPVRKDELLKAVKDLL